MKSIESFEHFTKDDYGDDRFFSANKGKKKQVNIHPAGRYPSNLMYFDELFPGQYDKFFMIPKPSGMEKYNLDHDTIKPFRLFYRLIRMFTPKPSVVKQDVIVLDPFCGVGTAGLACMDLGRKFVGIDINQQYCEQAKDRLKTNKKTKDIMVS